MRPPNAWATLSLKFILPFPLDDFCSLSNKHEEILSELRLCKPSFVPRLSRQGR
jgi:hypothetical protein